jgi:Cof subfamily protein (haloacid dehalogenase superfamily)
MNDIRLVISDVDGTLVTSDKQLTQPTRDAVRALRDRGIRFTITSSRPSFGMTAVVDTLGIDLPFGAFNGSAIVNPDLSVLQSEIIPSAAAQQSLVFLARKGIDVWIFTDREWIAHRDDGQYVPHERNTIQTDAVFVTDDTPYVDKACKIVGVSADFALLAACEAELQAEIGAQAHVARSQNYYLDITPPGVDKGSFVTAIAARLGIPLANVATIGDMQNDVPMFRTSGLSFAMGNASDAVKARASRVTASNAEDGFAKAMSEILRA